MALSLSIIFSGKKIDAESDLPNTVSISLSALKQLGIKNNSFVSITIPKNTVTLCLRAIQSKKTHDAEVAILNKIWAPTFSPCSVSDKERSRNREVKILKSPAGYVS